MNLIQFYAILSLAPLGLAAGRYSYNVWQKFSSTRKAEWKANEAMTNFKELCASKREDFPPLLCPEDLYTKVPYLHQGVLNTASAYEADRLFNHAAEAGSIAIGLCIPAMQIFRFFNTCLSKNEPGFCVKSGLSDLLLSSGLSLAIGAYLISRLARYLIIGPLISACTGDLLRNTRVQELQKEYKTLLNALNELLNRSSNDPDFIAAADTVKQFLRLHLSIEEELHASLAIDLEEAKEILLPIQTACRQILVKKAMGSE